MRKILLMFALALSAGALPVTAGAHGCIKGAVVGGVVGHLAGHHGVAGAAVGCAARGRALERAKRFFQRVHGRIRHSRITKSFVDADRIVHECTGLIERKQDRAGVGIQRTSAMNCDGRNV